MRELTAHGWLGDDVRPATYDGDLPVAERMAVRDATYTSLRVNSEALSRVCVKLFGTRPHECAYNVHDDNDDMQIS